MKHDLKENNYSDMEVLEDDRLDSVAGGVSGGARLKYCDDAGAALQARHSGKKTAIRSVSGGIQGPWRVMYKCTRCGASVEKYVDVTDAAMIPETCDF